MQREDMLAKVDAAYKARRTGDFSEMDKIVAPDAVFSYGGEQKFLKSVPPSGTGNAEKAARELFETIEMRSLERVSAVAEEDRIAILWTTTLVPPGGEPFETQLFDLWEFDASGRICKGTQFIDG